LSIIFDPLHDDTVVPFRATEGSAGYDLRAYLRGATVRCSNGERQWDRIAAVENDVHFIRLQPGEMALVPLGFRARVPDGIEAQVRPRSGAAFKQGLHIANTPGTIDSDYPGEWMVPVLNGSVGTLTISHGDRIAQVVFSRFEALTFERGDVGTSSSRTGGFGSTGR
jgi:dUTP pyrophosphatase